MTIEKIKPHVPMSRLRLGPYGENAFRRHEYVDAVHLQSLAHVSFCRYVHGISRVPASCYFGLAWLG